MNVDNARMVLVFIEQHRSTVLACAVGLLVALAAVGLVLRKYGRSSALYDNAAVLVAIALSAEGMWEAATESLHLAWWKALLLFAFAELAMLRAARRARVKAGKGKRAGQYGVLVWTIAVSAGLIAATNAPNLTEFLIRVGAPLLVAAQWWADLVELLRENRGIEQEESAWIWTPNRIGVRLGLVKPGRGDDLAEVFQRRDVDKMVRTARRLRSAGPRRAARLAGRLQRLGESVDEAGMAAAVERYRRGERVQQAMFGAVIVPPVTRVTQPGDAGDAVPVAHADAPVTRPADAPTAGVVDVPVTHPDASADADADAPARQATQAAQPAVTHPLAHVDAVPRRTREVVMRRPVSAPPVDRDAALRQAADAVLTRKASVRGAARDADVPEATLRRHLAQVRAVPQKVNGHSFEPAGK